MVRVRESVGRAGRDHPLRTAVLALAAAWLSAEAAHARAARAAATPAAAPDTILVLGCPSDKQGRASAMQLWRVDLAARNAGPDTRFVFTGAHEAGSMAAQLTARHGVLAQRITLEKEATNTWENIGNSAALIATGGVLWIVSDPLHARRGERYWRLQLPERAGELGRASLYRFGEHPLLKLRTAAYELLLRGLRYRPPR